VLKRIDKNSSDTRFVDIRKDVSLTGMIDSQYCRWSAIGSKRGPYIVNGKTLKICFYTRSNTYDSDGDLDRQFSPTYLYEVYFNRDFDSNSDICEYINEKLYEIHQDNVIANITSDQEVQSFNQLIVPFVRPDRDGYIQIWTPTYYRLIPSEDTLKLLGFSTMTDKEVKSIDVEQEIWSELTPDERIAIYGNDVANSSIYQYIPPQIGDTIDTPTDLYIIKDPALISPYYLYAIHLYSEYFQPKSDYWWRNEIDSISRLRDRFINYACTDPFYCDFMDYELIYNY
jgi:hypothetical protein